MIHCTYRDGLLLWRQLRQHQLCHCAKDAHKIAGRHEKPRLIAKWARSYHESDPAAINLWYSRAAPCHSGYEPLARCPHRCTPAWGHSPTGVQVWWLPQGHEDGVKDTHVLWGGLRVFIHGACYWYGEATNVQSCSRG